MIFTYDYKCVTDLGPVTLRSFSPALSLITQNSGEILIRIHYPSLLHEYFMHYILPALTQCLTTPMPKSRVHSLHVLHKQLPSAYLNINTEFRMITCRDFYSSLMWPCVYCFRDCSFHGLNLPKTRVRLLYVSWDFLI